MKPIHFLPLALCLLASCAQQPTQSPDPADEQQLYIGDNIAVAKTQYGYVKGYILHGTYTYLGIPYGKTTEGEGRFLPAQAPTAWNDTLPTVFYAASAPQFTEGKYANNYYTFTDHWNYYDVGEDCLKLNVWTQGLADGKKRPVLFWIHGGGFTNGNGIEQDGYHGENLSRYGDVVFVSVNHRLGPIGFSDFSAVDPRYADSGNVGILDLVEALRWVKNNIEAFGGDPANVTIMGQSGGGAKVCTLVSMDECKGLISKAVALSGNIYSAIDQNYSSALGQYIYQKAGRNMKKLTSMPWIEYLRFANEAAAEFNQKTKGNGMMRGAFGPVADGRHIPKGTFFQDPNGASANVPMIFSTTTCENSISRTNAALETLTDEQLVPFVERSKPGRDAKAIIEAYRKALPDKSGIELLGYINSSRDRVIGAINAKAVQPAPLYLAWFDWQPPLFDGRMRAFHCLDICFWFRNTDLMVTHTGGGARPRVLSTKMADALLAFMRTGDPNCASLPEWPLYTPETGQSMLLNDDCHVVDDIDRDARALLQ